MRTIMRQDSIGRIGDEFMIFVERHYMRADLDAKKSKRINKTFDHLFEMKKKRIRFLSTAVWYPFPDNGEAFKNLYSNAQTEHALSSEKLKPRTVIYAYMMIFRRVSWIINTLRHRGTKLNQEKQLCQLFSDLLEFMFLKSCSRGSGRHTVISKKQCF